jgi:hypothetical protein
LEPTSYLPLTAAEKKIAPDARTILMGVESFIQKHIGTLKTPAALTSLWGSLRGYTTRNSTNSAKQLTLHMGLTPAEMKIAPGARTILVGVENFIRTNIGTIKTHAGVIAFWSSLHELVQRNYTASSTGTAASSSRPKTRGAGSSA